MIRLGSVLSVGRLLGEVEVSLTPIRQMSCCSIYVHACQYYKERWNAILCLQAEREGEYNDSLIWYDS